MTLEGIPPGTIRSNMADVKIDPENWCQIFGHKMTLDSFAGSHYCRVCFKTEKEINGKETEGRSSKE